MPLERGRNLTVLWEMLTELFVQSYFQQSEPLIYIFSFLWHKIMFLIFNIFIYAKVGHSKFGEMHRDALHFYRFALVFYARHRVNITIYRTVYFQTLMHIQLKNILWTSVALFHFCNLINNNYNLYCLQFLTDSIHLCYIFIPNPSYL